MPYKTPRHKSKTYQQLERDAGWAARVAGLPRDANPHKNNESKHRYHQWRDGWLAADEYHREHGTFEG